VPDMDELRDTAQGLLDDAIRTGLDCSITTGGFRSEYDRAGRLRLSFELDSHETEPRKGRK